MKRFLLLLFIYCQLPFAYSQAPQSWTSADMYLAIRKLNVLGSVLYIAAHPDDENTRLITYFSKDRTFRTGYLSLTRGDGGQNLIGDEQGIDLGLIRTQELLAARRIDGGEQFFSRAFDFGYSKNPEETFTKWDREKILSDVVWVIRKFQPDVIVTRFPTTGEGGHGHHTASAILANEAFTAAADPARFPDQLQYVQPWQAKRILWNTFNFGGTNTTREDQFKIDVGGYNPLLGKSYGEIASISRSQHKTQGFGSALARGEAVEYLATTGGSAPVNDIMDGIDLTWKRVKGGEAIKKMIDMLAASFDMMHPEKSVKSLVSLYQAISALPDGYWKKIKLQEVKQLIEQCSGLFIDVTSSDQYAVQMDSIKMNFVFNDRLGVNAVLKKITLGSYDSSFNLILAKNKNIGFSQSFFVPLSKPVTQPYWLEEAMATGYYNVSNQQKIGQPDVDPAYIADMVLTIEGQDIPFSRPVKYKFTDPVKGEIYQPLVVVPPILINVEPEIAIKTGDASSPFSVTTRAVRDFKSKDASLLIDAPGKPAFLATDLPSIEKGRIFSGEYRITDSAAFSPRHIYIKNGNETYTKGSVTIQYDHIPTINYFKESGIRLSAFDLKTYNKKIGYITGAGDKVPDALQQMGYEVTLLGEKELARNNLDQYDAIITGVRAYNTNEWMNKYYDRLMKYIEDGGNLIVQYNTSTNIGPVKAKISPYNFNISRTRVTDENAEVVFLKPDHPVMNFPNKITQDDFRGWIQERSTYHASGFDSKNFETIFSMHDPGDKDDDGSLIIAKYGKGYFTYCGLVFFRELPAGVPGAYRLMANIIALNKKKGF